MNRALSIRTALSPLLLLGCFAVSLVGCGSESSQPKEAHQRLLDRGYAELENERPGDAEATFSELILALPSEPAGHANLAISRLRQQNFEGAQAAIEEALRVAPQNSAVAAIAAEILHWTGQEEEALVEFERAAALAPNDLEILFRLYEHANQQRSDRAASVSNGALEQLVDLRPENLVLLLAQGRRALDNGDRAEATRAFLRVGELLWQATDPAPELLRRILAALESNELTSARGPAQGLENVLKITPMYQQGLRELATAIQGVPIARLLEMPATNGFGDAIATRFTASPVIDSQPVTPGGLVVADFDRDGTPDVVWQGLSGGLHWLPNRAERPIPLDVGEAPSKPTTLGAIDLDNNGYPDLLRLGTGSQLLLGQEEGFSTANGEYELPELPLLSAVAIDFDIEGDLDVALVKHPESPDADPAIDLLRNALDGSLESVAEKAFDGQSLATPTGLLASDFDRDGDVDLIALHENGVQTLRNLRQGEFETVQIGVEAASEVVDAASVDLDNDGWPDLVVASNSAPTGDGEHLVSWQRNEAGRFGTAQSVDTGLGGRLEAVVALDANSDGRLDLGFAGSEGVSIALQSATGAFVGTPVEGASPAHTLVPIDFDGDGDEDLIAAGDDGVQPLLGSGAESQNWLRVQLRGLQKGSSKNNSLGIGSTLEVRVGSDYQFREVTSDTTFIGLGDAPTADVVRVVWTNGVPQNRIDLAANQAIVEEQLLKGSCPFVYVWNGEAIEFGTDLLWGSPIGLPVGPGVWAGADPTEIVHLPNAVPRDGYYDLRVTEELWEAAFLDLHRLWIVDHPADVEVASNLSVLPGRVSDPKVLATRQVRPVAHAWNAVGDEVTERVQERDEIYADGWERSAYQGRSASPWTFTFDLGEAPGGPIRLLLDGWIFPSDASLNLAMAQRSDLGPPGPRLEVETAAGWQPLLDPMAFPAGKTKTMVVDTPPLPAGARRLRIASSLWLSWDRIRWSSSIDDDAPRVTQLTPSHAELGYRGFSRPVRRAPNAPHEFDYARSTTTSPWLSFPGSYTRYGNVLELIESSDDRMVNLAPGDEMTLRFDVRELSPPAEGWKRTVFLESHGWDKDADRNTLIAESMEPLPFRAMKEYGTDPYPDRPELLAYREQWLNRKIE